LRHSVRDVLGFIATLSLVFSATSASAQGRCEQPVARIVSAEGNILVRPASGMLIVTIAAGGQGEICAGESVQAGSRSRAAVLLLSSNQIIRLDQNTTIRVIGETPQERRSLIDLVQGFIRLFNPVGRALDIRTPFVTAGTEGTEFYVSYDPRNEDTIAGVIDGVVRVSKNADVLRLSPGEAVRVPRTGPFERLNIRPRDAVRWTIFYPAAMWNLPPTEEAALDPRVSRAWQAWRNGDLSAFASALDAIPPQAPLDARSLLRFAALLLVVGQVDEASTAIDRAEAMNVGSPLVPGLRAVIAVAQNRTDDALALSERAVAAAHADGDPAAAVGAALARSYALQSAFRLAEARDVLASVETTADSLVFARLAELDLSLGNNSDALSEAERAREIAPSLSLASSIVGFSALADFEFAAARAAFEKAAASSPGDPLAHLGLGLTSIRSGDLGNGRREMAIAVALDPENAVSRSYLGKTYAALGLSETNVREAAFREWALAEAADPKDPTAPLYRAFAERALNRPVEALEDIQKSIALNDNRAVYRSRLLLDQDLATRTTDLASVYRDLGFDQLAVSEGYKSVNVDPANPGAHRLLSDNYLNLPRHETASDSELLQSLLLQPLNVQPLRPRLAREGLGILDLRGPSRIGFNEFSPVFASDGVSLLADGFGGTQGTYGDNLVASGIYRNLSFSLGQFYFDTNGIRPNDEFRRDVEDALVQVALSSRISVLAEYRRSALKTGDTFLFFDPKSFTLNGEKREDRGRYRVGGRIDINEGVTVVGVWTRERIAGPTDNGRGFVVDTTSNGDFAEAAIYLSRPDFNVVGGGGYLDGDSKTVIGFLGRVLPQSPIDTTHANAWVYATSNSLENVQLILGASFDRYRNVIINRDEINPKVGLTWELVPGSILRGAFFQTIKRTTFSGQTIEPTQIAGFNQLYDDVNGTKTRRWGAGFDQTLGDRVFAGVEWSQRQLNVPIRSGGVTTEQYQKEDVARAYLDWVATDRFSVNFGVQWERFVRDPLARNDLNFVDQDLLRMPIEVRYSDPSGIFAFLRATAVRETGHFFSTVTSKIFGGSETFSVVDVGVGWRMPGRPVVGSLQVKNLLNSAFRFQDTDPLNPTIIPKRLIMGRITWSF
jgi:tetratricopeptide (TPR) repeat protein